MEDTKKCETDKLMQKLMLCIKTIEAPHGLLVRERYSWNYANPPVRIISDTCQQKIPTREWLRQVHAYFSSMLRQTRCHHTGNGGFALNQLWEGARYHNERSETCCGFLRVVCLCRQIAEKMELEPFDVNEDRFTIPDRW